MNWDDKNPPKKFFPGDNSMNTVPYSEFVGNDNQFPQQASASYPRQPAPYPQQPIPYIQQPYLNEQHQFYEPPPLYEYPASSIQTVRSPVEDLTPGQRSWYRTIINDQGEQILGTFVCCQIFFGVLFFLVLFIITYRIAIQ